MNSSQQVSWGNDNKSTDVLDNTIKGKVSIITKPIKKSVRTTSK